MKMVAKGNEFHAGNNAAYLAGIYDRETHTFMRKAIRSIDYGIDFYAPQSTVTPDGRRVMTAWMQTPRLRVLSGSDSSRFRESSPKRMVS